MKPRLVMSKLLCNSSSAVRCLEFSDDKPVSPMCTLLSEIKDTFREVIRYYLHNKQIFNASKLTLLVQDQPRLDWQWTWSAVEIHCTWRTMYFDRWPFLILVQSEHKDVQQSCDCRAVIETGVVLDLLASTENVCSLPILISFTQNISQYLTAAWKLHL